MSYKFSFADNEVYSATDVNNITKRLVTSGVADSFSDGVAYNVSRFNEAGKLLYTSGVVSEDCNTLKVTKISDTEILINPGTAFFDDGAVIEIEEGGESLTFVSGSKNYVYLKNELLDENRCYPCVSVNEPTGDYVLLAEITENGNIVDKRTYAKGKIPGYQSVAGNVLRIQDTIRVAQEGKSKTFDIGNNNFEYILVYVKHNSVSLPCLGIYDIVNKSYLGFGCYNEKTGYNSTNDTSYHLYYQVSSPLEDSLYIRRDYSTSTQIAFSIDSGKLTVTVVYGQENCNLDLILF